MIDTVICLVNKIEMKHLAKPPCLPCKDRVINCNAQYEYWRLPVTVPVPLRPNSKKYVYAPVGSFLSLAAGVGTDDAVKYEASTVCVGVVAFP
jgi:hypothetical protein